MSAQHTPGPWVVKGRVNSSLEAVRIESHNAAPEHHLYQVADVLDANGYPQNEANLLLIAAAPEMLDALRRAVLALAFASESSAAMRDDYEAVSRAIAKATRGEA